MITYADTSWWFGYKCRGDIHHAAAIKAFDSPDDLHVIWTPWQRVEVFNTFRQAMSRTARNHCLSPYRIRDTIPG